MCVCVCVCVCVCIWNKSWQNLAKIVLCVCVCVCVCMRADELCVHVCVHFNLIPRWPVFERVGGMLVSTNTCPCHKMVNE